MASAILGSVLQSPISMEIINLYLASNKIITDSYYNPMPTTDPYTLEVGSFSKAFYIIQYMRIVPNYGGGTGDVIVNSPIGMFVDNVHSKWEYIFIISNRTIMFRLVPTGSSIILTAYDMSISTTAVSVVYQSSVHILIME